MPWTSLADASLLASMNPALTDSQGALDGPSYGITTFNKTIADPQPPHHTRSVRMRPHPLPQITNQDPETMEVAGIGR
jgi:hypothetical protein